MKKICGLFLVFSLFATCALADGDGDKILQGHIQNSPSIKTKTMKDMIAYSKSEAGAHKKLRWSWGAIGEVYKAMIDQCHSVDSAELKYMGKWFRENGNEFSLAELVQACRKAGFQEIDRNFVRGDKKYECKLPKTNCDSKGCGETEYVPKNLAINIFISTLIEKNHDEKIKASLRSDMVGTFVEKTKDGVYRIVDVVLPNNYWNNGEINYEVNTNERNTRIYEIYTDKDGSPKVKYTGWHTWTADMFFDVWNNSYSPILDKIGGGGARSVFVNGSVTGVTVNSFIFPKEDLTKSIFGSYYTTVWTPVHTVVSASFSFPKQPYDIKKYSQGFSDKYGVTSEQKETEGHSNGVMLNGKIATVDWVGHFLFGLNAQGSNLPNSVAEEAAQKLSIYTQGTLESSKMQVAWKLGQEAAKRNKAKRDRYYKDEQTADPKLAFANATKRAKENYSFQEKIECLGFCNPIPGSQDIVTCIDATGRVQEFEFDDICNK